MSNDQWNNTPGDDQRARGAPHHPEHPTPHAWVPTGDPSHGGHWNPPPAEPPVAPGQPAAPPDSLVPASVDHETSSAAQQDSANEWTTGAQQQPSAAEWHVQPHQGPRDQPNTRPAAPGQTIGPGAGPQPGHNPQGRAGPGQQHRPMPVRQRSGLLNVFDFSFRRLALPEASGAIFLIVVIATGVWWLVDLIYAASFGAGVFDSAAVIGTQLIIGGLARSVLIILAARVFIEGMSALVVRTQRER